MIMIVVMRAMAVTVRLVPVVLMTMMLVSMPVRRVRMTMVVIAMAMATIMTMLMAVILLPAAKQPAEESTDAVAVLMLVRMSGMIVGVLVRHGGLPQAFSSQC
jgi:hypothetical protein